MNKEILKPVVEALLFASEKPLDATEILKIIQRAEEEKFLNTAVENLENVQSDNAEIQSTERTEISLEQQVSEIFDEVYLQDMSDGRTASLSSEESLDSNVEQTAEEQLLSLQSSEEEKIGRADIQQIIFELVQEYEQNASRGFILLKVAEAYQFRTRSSLAKYVRAMSKVAPTKLSQAALETLAIIAYRQPITRVEVDQIRGVDSGGVVKSLSDRDLIKIVGKKDEAGRPLLYGTTEGFLEVFNLGSLQELPSLKDLHQIEDELKQNSKTDNVIQLESSEDEIEAVEQEMELKFSELQEEEEEAFGELDEEMKLLQDLDAKVKNTLEPPVPVAENNPVSENQSV